MSGGQSHAVAGVLQALRDLARDTGSDGLDWFAGQMAGLDAAQTTAKTLPVCDLLEEALSLTNAATRPTVQAIVAAAPSLHWQQSYTRADGFSDSFLDAYGWFNLVSDEGAFTHDAIRVSVGYWGRGLGYREHWHAPEETYIVLAGEAVFNSSGRAPRTCRAGDIVHHASNQPHSIDMTPGPLLAAAFWRGEGLQRISTLGETP